MSPIFYRCTSGVGCAYVEARELLPEHLRTCPCQNPHHTDSCMHRSPCGALLVPARDDARPSFEEWGKGRHPADEVERGDRCASCAKHEDEHVPGGPGCPWYTSRWDLDG